ncbi:MAG: YceI family protein [Candidatus Kapaibacterium sp.]
MEKTDVMTQTRWSIDPEHSEIGFEIDFTVKHLMISHVKGIFKTFDANIYTHLNDFTTVGIDIWIDVNSISTGDRKRDEHLKSADFFDAQNHKQITLVSKEIEKSDSSIDHELWGELTMKGITKSIKLNVEYSGMLTDPWKNERAGFMITGKIKRSDWGMVWNTILEIDDLMVSDEVTISCEVELIKVDQNGLTMQVEPAVEINNLNDSFLLNDLVVIKQYI